MGTDIRYLVITLVAVFVALAIGVLVGVAITDEPSLKKLSNQFSREFDKVRAENAAMRVERDRARETYQDAEKLIRVVLPSLLQGRLAGQRIAVIVAGDVDHTSFLDEIEHNVEMAGGQITSRTLFHSAFPFMSASELIAYQEALGLQDLATAVLPKHVSAKLAAKIAVGNAGRIAGSLTRLKLVEMSGDYSIPVQKVIVVNGGAAVLSKTEEKNPTDLPARPAVARATVVDLPVIETLKSLGTVVVGAETSDVAESCMADYQRQDIPTVDNVETLVGQVSLVYILSGAKGNYGTKDTADRLLPTPQITPAK